MNLNETEKKPIERIQEEELEERIQRFLGYTVRFRELMSMRSQLQAP